MGESTKALTDGKEQPERKLPDEQVKGKDGEDVLARIDEANEINEMMSEIRHRTNPDGTLLGKVKRIHIAEKNPRIAVMVDLPAEDEDHRFEFIRPKVWSARYDFVRFVEHYADHPGDIDYLVEENVDVNIMELDDEHSNDYRIVYPDESTIGKTRRTISARISKNWQRFKSGENGADEVVQKTSTSVGVGGFLIGLALIPQAADMILFDALLRVMASILVGAIAAVITLAILIAIGIAVFNWDGPPT